MKQVFELGVLAPSGCKLEDFQGVYQSGEKLIALIKLSKSDEGFALSKDFAAVEIDVPGSNELPVECYIIADRYWGSTDRLKEITERDVPNLIEGLTSLNITKVAPKETKRIKGLREYELEDKAHASMIEKREKAAISIIEKAQQFTGLNRNTLFAVSAVVTSIAVAGAGVAMMMTNKR